MKNIFLLTIITIALSACKSVVVTTVDPAPKQYVKIEPKTIEATGYGSLSNFKSHSTAQKKLLAMRAAKLDAYRNLAEELYGVKIKSNTTVKEMAIENDSYRAYVDALIRGAHLLTITPKADGIYEAIVSLTLRPVVSSCLYYPQNNCSDPIASPTSAASYHTYSDPGYSYPPINAGYYDCQPNCQNPINNQNSYYVY